MVPAGSPVSLLGSAGASVREGRQGEQGHVLMRRAAFPLRQGLEDVIWSFTSPGREGYFGAAGYLHQSCGSLKGGPVPVLSSPEAHPRWVAQGGEQPYGTELESARHR